MSAAVAVRERGILMSGPMVRGLIDDRKTQTRRTRKLDHVNRRPGDWTVSHWEAPDMVVFRNVVSGALWGVRCPYGQPGDRLWVRETFLGALDPQDRCYRVACPCGLSDAEHARHVGWKPSIHMPRWASRLTLEITAVRVERVQDITSADARAEGVVPPDPHTTSRAAFAELWDSLNASRGYDWTTNPWVWVLDFRKVVP